MWAHVPIALAVVVLPLVVAALSRRILTFLGALLLATIAPVVLVDSDLGATTIAAALYVGSLIVAFSGIVARRRDRAVQAELASLRAELNELAAVQSRQFITELNKPRAKPVEAAEPPP